MNVDTLYTPRDAIFSVGKSRHDRRQKQIVVEGLFEEFHGAHFHCFYGERHVSMAGHRDNSEIAVLRPQATNQLDAVHPWHANVGNNAAWLDHHLASPVVAIGSVKRKTVPPPVSCAILSILPSVSPRAMKSRRRRTTLPARSSPVGLPERPPVDVGPSQAAAPQSGVVDALNAATVVLGQDWRSTTNDLPMTHGRGPAASLSEHPVGRLRFDGWDVRVPRCMTPIQHG